MNLLDEKQNNSYMMVYVIIYDRPHNYVYLLLAIMFLKNKK